jgi:prolyl oligopeptidase
MKHLVFFLSVIIHLAAMAQPYKYPIAIKDSTVDSYHGTEVKDPYRWMEDLKDPRLNLWLEEQKKFTKRQQKNLKLEDLIHRELASFYFEIDYSEIDSVRLEKTKTKYRFRYHRSNYNSPPDLQLKGPDHVGYKTVFRTREFAINKDENVEVSDYKVNEDLEKLFVLVNRDGSDWREAYFFNLSKGIEITDTLENLRLGSNITWVNGGVIYDAYKKPEQHNLLRETSSHQALYYHRFGTSQIDDVLLYRNPDTTGNNMFTAKKLDENRLYMDYNIYSRGIKYNALGFADISKPESIYFRNFLVYPDNSELEYRREFIQGDTIFLWTNQHAPNGKLVATNINQKNKLFEIVPESYLLLDHCNPLGDKLACVYKEDRSQRVIFYDSKGNFIKLAEVEAGQKINYLYEFERKARRTEISISSFFAPDIWYWLNLDDLSLSPSQKISVPYDPTGFQTELVYYNSTLGAEVPMFITYKKGMKKKGSNPTLLHVYGGYGITKEPKFDRDLALWISKGGVYAVAGIRGGGAKGEEWHEQGKGILKVNTIDDINNAAEYLIDEGFTNPGRLGLMGASHGGMVVAAAAIKRPELYKIVVSEAGPHDMLRFGKYTIGKRNANLREFGDVAIKREFDTIYSYSPLHNIIEGEKYPNMLLITGESDERVPPFHSYKLLARLQDKASKDGLYQLYIIPNAGHFGATSANESTDYLRFKYHYLFYHLELDDWYKTINFKKN